MKQTIKLAVTLSNDDIIIKQEENKIKLPIEVFFSLVDTVKEEYTEKTEKKKDENKAFEELEKSIFKRFEKKKKMKEEAEKENEDKDNETFDEFLDRIKKQMTEEKSSKGGLNF